MEPHGPRFGGGATATILHPAIVVLMVLSIVLFFVLPRKYMIVPVMVSTFLIPMGQQFVIGGVHLFVARILILVAFIRAYSSKPKSLYAGGWNSIDTAFTCYVVITSAATMITFQDGAALVNQIGYLWDFLLAYLLLRSLIRNEKDSFLTIKCFAVLMVLLAAAMLYEQMKMVNIFGLLGGVNAVPEVREGKIRSQAVFQHSLTAGTFAATAIPLFFLLWKNGKAKTLAVVGIAAATVMTVTTQTSTSLDDLRCRHRSRALVADPEEDEDGAHGPGGRSGSAASSDEGSSLVLDRPHRPDGILVQLSPSRTHRSIHQPFHQLVAHRNQGRRDLGLGYVGRAEYVCVRGRGRRLGSLYRVHPGDLRLLLSIGDCEKAGQG